MHCPLLLSHLDSNVFKDLINLEKLYLSRHRLTCFEPGLFSSLKNLKSLDLNHNQLKNLDEEVFKDLQKLENLYLLGNKFNSIQSQVFRPLVKLKELSLDDHLFVNSEDLWDCVGKYYANWRGIECSETTRPGYIQSVE